jgi:Zn-dependent protease with chaperone function
MARPGADFFELQDEARRGTTRLVVLYLAAVLAVAAALGAAVAVVYAAVVLYWGGPLPDGMVLDYSHLLRSYFRVLAGGVPRAVYLWPGGGALAVMVAASLWRMWQLREGGEAVAELLGARQIYRRGATPNEARLLNVVEEMALAARIAPPPAYVLEREPAINALAAGYARGQAVIIVTQGTLDRLTRDELQGVIAHEFSHILNGDIRLNLRLMALLYGIAFIGQAGYRLMRAESGAAPLVRGETIAAIHGFVAGGLLSLIGYFGLLAARYIQAAISREREFLADAASVQFTRNPDGIAGALDSIRALRVGSYVWNPLAEQVSHMFCAQGAANALGPSFATHPPIDERIRRIHPGFRRDEYRAARGGVYEQHEIAVFDGLGDVVGVITGKAAEPRGAARD